MAVVYFTNNASTGSGSLVAAVAAAEDGDIVRPDETVFGRGATVEIALASRLDVRKTLTIDGGACRIRLNGGSSVVCLYVREGDATFISVDVVAGRSASTSSFYPGGVRVDASATFKRCRITGCESQTTGGAMFIASSGVANLVNCLVVGNRSAAGYGGIAVGGVVNVAGSTLVGNLSATGANDVGGSGTVDLTSAIVGVNTTNEATSSGSVVGVALSQIGFVAPPQDDLTVDNWCADAWESWDLRLLDDASPTPSPYRDSGDVDAASKYDLDGNFRGRETNGVATCSPGAYETLQADLFWIGCDATGTEVVLPSFLTSNGWATSRFAIVSGDVAPTTGAALFVGETVSFDDAPPFAAALVVGADNVVISSAVNAYLTIGATRAATVGGTLAALKLGDYAELNPSSSLEIPAVEFGGANIVIDNVSVEINDGVIFAATPRPAAITMTGSGGWADTTVGVSSLDVNATDAQTIEVSIVKSDTNKAAFVQYSINDGATWRTVATTAAVDEYELTVAQGADVTVRVATATGWLTDTVSTAPFLPVWTVSNGYEMVAGVSNVFEIATGGSNDGLNTYDFNNYGYL